MISYSRPVGKHLAGDDWYRARIEAGHEWTVVPGTHSRLPKIEDEPWEPMSVLEGMTDLMAVDPEDASLSADVPDLVRSALWGLPERTRRILELRYGFEGKSWPLGEVAHEFDMTPERVRQIEAEGLKRMKDALSRTHRPQPPWSWHQMVQYFTTSVPIPTGPPIQMLQADPPVSCPCCGNRLDYPDHHSCVIRWLEAQP